MCCYFFYLARASLREEKERGKRQGREETRERKDGEKYPLKYPVISDLAFESSMRFCTAVNVDCSFCPVTRKLSTTTWRDPSKEAMSIMNI